MTSFAVHQDLAHRIAGLPHIAALSLHDADGNLINFSRSWPAPDIDVRDRDFIKVLLAPNPPKTVISQPQKSKTTGQWTIFFSRRFEAPDGRLIGIVLSTIFTDYFEQLFSRHGIERRQLLRALPRRRNAAGSLPAGRLPASGRRSTAPRISIAGMPSLDHGVARITSTMDGKDRLIAGHSVAHYPLMITVSDTMDAILDSWRARGPRVRCGDHLS